VVPSCHDGIEVGLVLGKMAPRSLVIRSAADDRRERMKAFAIDGFGEQGSVRDLPVPDPAEGHLRLRVAAADLNPFDVAVVQGYLKDQMEHRYPLVPGTDASGTVDAVGEGVEGYAVGDEVFGSVGKSYLGEGTLAEFTGGEIVAPEIRSYALADAGEALAVVGTGHVRGKLVVTV
jgi:hypothetical protein